jgi:hypothetical protein
MLNILTLADSRSDITLDDALDSVPGAREVFADPIEVLFDIQMFWTSQLTTQLDRLVVEGAETPEIGVISAWVDAAVLVPGARRLLDAHADDPRLAKAHQKQDELIARAAGVPVMSRHLLARGREITESARSAEVLPEIAILPERPATLLDRLRSALAA